MKKIKHLVDTELCTECQGLCCKLTIRRIPVTDLDTRNAEFFRARCVDQKLIGQTMYYFLNQQCPHITDTGCELKDDKPEICKEFPPYKDEDWFHFCPLSKKLYN